MRRKKIFCILGSGVVILGGMLFSCDYVRASVDSSYMREAMLSTVELRKYFEQAMELFELGKYKEAVLVFEKLIEVEKKQGQNYFTPFAEIYIDKSKDRMKELMIVQDKRWEKIRQDVISETEEMARGEVQKKGDERETTDDGRWTIKEQKTQDVMEKREEADQKGYEGIEKKIISERKAKRALEAKKQDDGAQSVYKDAMECYNQGDFPLAIIKFKKVKELDPESSLAEQADFYIAEIQRTIKKNEEKMILVRMEEARKARLQMEREDKLKELERIRQEKEKQALKRVFVQRLKTRLAYEKVFKVTKYMDDIVKYVKVKQFEEAEKIVNSAMSEFPENTRFKDILHYIALEKIRQEEDALERARELTEEKMLLEVAKQHILPGEKTAMLEKGEKKKTPLVKVPEIRTKLKIPISVDFKNVELDYVLGFLSDATGVNIVPSSQIDMGEKKVSIKIKDMPLEEALRYILKAQDLVYRIEEDAVWVAAKDEMDNEKIETRVYFLNQGIGKFSEFSVEAKSESGSLEGEQSSSASEVKTVKDILQNTVDWPKDSKLTLDERTGALIMSNTPSNLEIIENLIYNLDVTPIQVLIEAKFLEVKATDVNELGVEWKVNSAWGVKETNASQPIHGIAANSGVDFTNFTRVAEGFNLTYQGILTHPQFQMILHALQEKQNVKTLSAPRITTLNNQLATIEVIDEYIYPTRYEASLVQYDINGDGDFDDAGETEWANIPQDFVTRNVGILLHVKPSVGVDKKTITLALTPEVSEASGSYSYSGNVTIPQFKTRNLSTSVVMQDGETIVMGGLMKETKTNVKTKVPVLGDIPLLGGLFRRSTEDTEKRNLLIFVTATVMNKDEEVIASTVK